MKEKSFTYDILMFLKNKSQDLLEISVMVIFDPKELVRQYGVNLYGGYSKNYMYRRMHNIKRSPYFAVKNNVFYISNKGRIEIIRSIIEDKKRAKKWDGKWRAVIFDVPEAKRYQRNFLRKELKLIGFRELQHSIWIIPYDIEKELLCLLKLWRSDFSGDIRFLVIEKMIDDNDFKELFTPQKSTTV